MTRGRILTMALGVSLLFNMAFAGTALIRWWATPAPAAEPSEQAVQERPAALWESLALTAEQQEVFAARRGRVSEHVSERRLQVREARERLWLLVATDDPTMPEISRQIDIISHVQKAVQETVVNHMLWMRGQLTDTQQERFDRFVEAKMCKCSGCDGGCLGGCPGGCRQAGMEGQCPNSKP